MDEGGLNIYAVLKENQMVKCSNVFIFVELYTYAQHIKKSEKFTVN